MVPPYRLRHGSDTLLPGPRRPYGAAVDGWCGWCCLVAFADVAEAADDGYVVDVVLPALAVRDDVVHLSGRWCLRYVVVELDLAEWTVA